jgi:hypothetical protein
MCDYERRRWQLILTAESGIRFRGCSLVRLAHDVSPVVAFYRFCLFGDDLERKSGANNRPGDVTEWIFRNESMTTLSGCHEVS